MQHKNCYLCAYSAISVQRYLSLHAFSCLCAEIAMRIFSYHCTHLAISACI